MLVVYEKKIIHANFSHNNDNAPGFRLLTVELCQDQGMEAGHTTIYVLNGFNT